MRPWPVSRSGPGRHAQYGGELRTMTTVIRPAGVGDVPVIAALLGELGYPTGPDEVTVRLAYWLDDPHSTLLVTEVNGQVSGVAAVHAIPLLEHTGRRGRLVALVVGDAFRSLGVGRAGGRR
jgi:N-acetylglutamate synthase-like GNAT family acetyltransferase